MVLILILNPAKMKVPCETPTKKKGTPTFKVSLITFHKGWKAFLIKGARVCRHNKSVTFSIKAE